MKAIQKGFTLIELMIVVAIIAILAALALPAYQDYTVRAKVSEALTAASSPKSAVSEGFQVNGMTGVASAAAAINSQSADQETKYVKTMKVDTNTGVILVTLQDNATRSGFPTPAQGAQLKLTPSINGQALADGLSGAIDWVCISASNAVATAHLPSGASADLTPPTTKALIAKYAPSECR